jgi:hypothetical protein
MVRKLIIITFLSDKDHRDHPKANLILRNVPPMDKTTRMPKKTAARTARTAIRLTLETLEKLKERGFQYVLVESYTLDRRLDYIEMNHFLLRPVKALPDGPGDLGIFEPIDSTILREWAKHPDNGIIAYIDSNSHTA